MKEYQPAPADTKNITLDQELMELSEKMARNVHDVWAQARMGEGWIYGPVKDSEKKETPCLVPYEDLPESEKDYDRNTAIETLKFLIKLGYSIHKR